MKRTHQKLLGGLGIALLLSIIAAISVLVVNNAKVHRQQEIKRQIEAVTLTPEQFFNKVKAAVVDKLAVPDNPNLIVAEHGETPGFVATGERDITKVEEVMYPGERYQLALKEPLPQLPPTDA